MSFPQETKPLNPASSLIEAATIRQPRKKRKVSRPKLTIGQLTSPEAISSIVSIGRATVEEYNEKGSQQAHARKLATVLRRAGRWASSVAPQHTMAQFVIEARGLASNRGLRSHVANVRLAQLRGADVATSMGDGHDNGNAGGDVVAEAAATAQSMAPASGGITDAQAMFADVPDELDMDGGNDDAALWDDADDDMFAAMEQEMEQRQHAMNDTANGGSQPGADGGTQNAAKDGGVEKDVDMVDGAVKEEAQADKAGDSDKLPADSADSDAKSIAKANTKDVTDVTDSGEGEKQLNTAVEQKEGDRNAAGDETGGDETKDEKVGEGSASARRRLVRRINLDSDDEDDS